MILVILIPRIFHLTFMRGRWCGRWVSLVSLVSFGLTCCLSHVRILRARKIHQGLTQFGSGSSRSHGSSQQ